jgi:hypothetical protein
MVLRGESMGIASPKAGPLLIPSCGGGAADATSKRG